MFKKLITLLITEITTTFMLKKINKIKKKIKIAKI
jgi:hypothetical protein